MKNFRFLAMLLLGVLLNVNLISCSKDDNLPEKGDDKVEHPNGIPNKIPNNIIYYTTNNNAIIRFNNEDVFGGAKIVSNTYSSTKGYGTIEFASEVTAIEANAFYERKALTYIALPNSVMSIGYKAFYYCSGLTSVTIPNSVESIGNSAFAQCSELASVTIGNSVTSIGDVAFGSCHNMTSIIIGSSVARIGANAFLYCSNLLDVYCYAENVPLTNYNSNKNAFFNSNIENATLHVPEVSVEKYKATTPWSNFGKIVAITQ